MAFSVRLNSQSSDWIRSICLIVSLENGVNIPFEAYWYWNQLTYERERKSKRERKLSGTRTHDSILVNRLWYCLRALHQIAVGSMDQVIIIRDTEVNPIAMIFHQPAANERAPLIPFSLLQSNLNRWFFFISSQCLLEHTFVFFLFLRLSFAADFMSNEMHG